MIFLAVTLGFFAENIREHNILQSMQNDLDTSAYVCADRDVTDTIGLITFKNYYLDYSTQLKLSDIPEGSVVNTTNKEGIQLYAEKTPEIRLLFTNGDKGGEDITILRSITNTIAVLNKEYNLE